MERKKFLQTIPLLGIAGTTLFSACSTTTGSDTGTGNELQGDAALVRNAAEREAVAIQTYTAAAESGMIENQAILDTAVTFRSHHEDHLFEFNTLLTNLGADTVALTDFSVDSRISEVSNQEQAIELAMTLEYEAAQAYFEQSTFLAENANSKRSLGNVYPVEVSHFITLKGALGRSPAINDAFFEGLIVG